jgi:cellulose synthase/poly-beta-1,6-N-acetylglucosamine synthase-like glycosyltransferase
MNVIHSLLPATVRLPGSDHQLFSVWLPFGFLGLIAWSVWLGRRLLTALYRPVDNEHHEPVTVVSPCFREDPEILEHAVRSWLAAGAQDVVLVFPLDEQENLSRADAAFSGERGVRFVQTSNPEKRYSLAAGILSAIHPVVVLSDSDTLWEPDLLEHLVMPFADPWIGGVGTRQRVLSAETSVWRRAADWMLDAKYLAYIPAMARKGGVSCLSGRTVAYRREVLLDVLPELTNETFFGRRCISGDDGRLTWLVLNKGYGTTFQQSAVAWTIMPDTARAFFRQRIRWSRNAWRCYLRAIGRGWLFRQPLITRVSVLQGLIAPVSLMIGFSFTALAIARGDLVAVAVWLVWITIGRGIRAIDHLRQTPRNVVLLPLMTGIVLFAMTAVRFWTLLTLNKQGWITRREDAALAEGQAAGSLGSDALRSTRPDRGLHLDLPGADHDRQCVERWSSVKRSS